MFLSFLFIDRCDTDHPRLGDGFRMGDVCNRDRSARPNVPNGHIDEREKRRRYGRGKPEARWHEAQPPGPERSEGLP
jgi:hypothetical protein